MLFFNNVYSSVVPKSALIPFNPAAEPFKSYAKNISHFLTDAGIRRALAFHDHNHIPKMFKWLQLAGTGYLDSTAPDESESEIELSSMKPQTKLQMKMQKHRTNSMSLK